MDLGESGLAGKERRRPTKRPREHQRARRATWILAVLLVCFAVAGCGSKGSTGSSTASGVPPTSTSAVGTIKNTKAKFVLHAGLAFGAFHRYIYKPFRAGDFSHPFTHKLTLLKAAAAALFVVHETKLAYADANADPTLSKLTAPLNALATKLSGLVDNIKGGHVSATDMSSLQGGVSSIGSLAASAGSPVKEIVPSL
jgi:hypothetical protein